MAALEALRGCELDAAAVALIKKSLANRSNFMVAKAARLAEDGGLADLLPDLVAAYDRFFINAEKTDPQCWAKNALSRALARLECRDKDVFLRGLRHHQMEPTWGGKSDSAGTLRANCAHALVACNGFDNQELLVLFLDPLVDADKSVRVEAVRALAQLGEVAVAVLRLRALIPGEEPEVLGQCFSALLAIERDRRFLSWPAFSRRETILPARPRLRWRKRATRRAGRAVRSAEGITDEWFSGVLLSAIALTRLPEAIDFLWG